MIYISVEEAYDMLIGIGYKLEDLKKKTTEKLQILVNAEFDAGQDGSGYKVDDGE